jgi:ketosteroid isomerase-like protein
VASDTAGVADRAEPKEDQMNEPIEEFLGEWATAERDGDTGKLETLLASDFTATGPLGFVLPRPAWLARHGQGGLAYQDFGLEEIQVRELGPVAVVTGRNNTQGSYQGHPIPEAVRATLVLVSDAGSWKLAAIHMSFIAGTRGAPPLPGPAPRAGQGAPE